MSLDSALALDALSKDLDDEEWPAMITSFALDAEAGRSWALPRLKMARLERFVVLAGRNGAGKTRILDALKWANSFKDRQRFALPQALPIVSLLPMQPLLQDLYDSRLTEHQVAEGIERNIGVTEMQRGAIAYAQKLATEDWNASNPKSKLDSSQKSETAARWESFQRIVSELLGEPLAHDNAGRVHLFGAPIVEAKLSPGQTFIFQVAVLLHAQAKLLPRNVFILDEPENHLHPGAAIDFVERLSNVAKGAQFWIATHSVPLIAWLHAKQPGCLWFVEDGKVKQAGREPEVVLESLLGKGDQVETLRSFMALPAQYAQINFAVQCLHPPEVAGDGSGDRQVSQISGILHGIRNGKQATEPDSKLRILDFGAGRGRLLEGSSVALLDYFAFEPSSQHRAECELKIMAVCGPGVRYFGNKDALFGAIGKKYLDVVVMCNVLHELSLDNWNRIFDNDGLIQQALAPNGYLLVVEDQRIPVGESAHKHGFLVLDSSHLKELFAIDQEVDATRFLTQCHPENARLKAHLIHASLLRGYEPEGRKRALDALVSTCMTEITTLRKKGDAYRNGLDLAFWTQQFANASLALKDL
jgi:AAA domain, putative AbiEii toxin, Type IV TA system